MFTSIRLEVENDQLLNMRLCIPWQTHLPVIFTNLNAASDFILLQGAGTLEQKIVPSRHQREF